MIHAEHRFLLPVARGAAFAYLSDPANDIEWQASCVAVRLEGAMPSVGCQYQITFRFLGRKMEFTCAITAFEPDQHYAFKVVEGSFHYEGSYTLQTHAQGTEVHWQFAAEPGKFFGILPASLLRKVLISQIEKDALTLACKMQPAASVLA